MIHALENLFMRAWWLALFSLLCFGLYEQGVRAKKSEYLQLKNQLKALETEYAVLEKEQEKLKLQINSQSDPEWIELVLLKGLGLVPENQTKVFFSKGEKWNN